MDTDDETQAWIAQWTSRWHDETAASWAIVDKQVDQPVGQVGLRTISLLEASAQLSYWVIPDARGADVATRAVRALTQWAIGTMRFHRLSLEHSTLNRASCRVATKTGFELEGTQREVMLHQDGRHDMHIHVRLRSQLST